MTATRFIPPGKWKSKGQAKHFTVAKARKAARAAKAWAAKSKSK